MKIKVLNKAILCAMSGAAVVGTLMVPQAALAQQQTLEEIVVTSRGREQTLQDVSLAVSVASGEFLERENIKTLQDVSARMGNVKITTGSLVNSMNIRGAGSGENPGFEQAVATFADGVYRSRSRSTMAALFDVERVEVIKGPQSTFFGANAVAGALSITTRKPDQEFAYNFTGLYGTDGEYNAEAGITLPVSDTLSVRLAGRVNGMDGFVKTPNGDGPDDESAQARFAVNWQPTDTWETDFRIDVVDSETENHAAFELLNCPPSAEYPYPFSPTGAPNNCFLGLTLDPGLEDRLNWESASPGSWQKYEFLETVLTNTWDMGPGTLRSITAYSDQEYRARINLIPMKIAGATQGYDPLPNMPIENYEFWSQEIRFESNTGDFLDYMFGAYYSEGGMDYDQPTTGFHFIPFGMILSDGMGNPLFPEIGPDTAVVSRTWSSIDDKTMSAFASSTMHFTDQFRLNLGLRYSKIEKDGWRDLTNGTAVNAEPDTFVPFQDPGAVIATCAIFGCKLGNYPETSIADSDLMPSAGIEFDIDENTMIYLNYSKGFKSGGFSTTASPSVFGPETVDAFELGLKGNYLDDRLRLGVALFTMEYQGLQETVFDSNLASSIANAAESTSQGAEANMTWQASDNISINADVAYLDAQYDSYPNGDCTKLQVVNTPPGQACVQDMSGKRRAYAPEWSGSIGANATFPVSDGLVFRVTPTVSYSGDYFMTATADPLFEQDSYAKFDLNMGLGSDDGRWEVSLIGRNLTDEKVTSYRLGTPGADGSVNAMTERGRSVALQFSMKH